MWKASLKQRIPERLGFFHVMSLKDDQCTKISAITQNNKIKQNPNQTCLILQGQAVKKSILQYLSK